MYEECKFLILSKSVGQNSRKTSHGSGGFSGLGAKPHAPTGNETPKIYGLVRCQFLVAQISTPGNRKWEIFWAGPKFWGPLAPPPMGVGGRGSCRLVDLVRVYVHKIFWENRNSGFREKSTFNFWKILWSAIRVNKYRIQTRIIKSSTSNKHVSPEKYLSYNIRNKMQHEIHTDSTDILSHNVNSYTEI